MHFRILALRSQFDLCTTIIASDDDLDKKINKTRCTAMLPGRQIELPGDSAAALFFCAHFNHCETGSFLLTGCVDRNWHFQPGRRYKKRRCVAHGRQPIRIDVSAGEVFIHKEAGWPSRCNLIIVNVSAYARRKHERHHPGAAGHQTR